MTRQEELELKKFARNGTCRLCQGWERCPFVHNGDEHLCDMVKLSRYSFELGQALRKENVEELVACLERNASLFGEGRLETFRKASRETQEATLRKMICERHDLPEGLRKKAAEWLSERGYHPGIL